MKAGLACLAGAYLLSQFYRTFLAVLSPVLTAEIGATPADLATSSGLWFLSFAAMQIPVGALLDRVGPRRTAAIHLALGGGGGALVLSLADGPMGLHLAMVLIGIGCAPILMAAYFIFARAYPPNVFGTLAGVMVGMGSLGNIAGAAPLALVVDTIGWRAAMGGLAALSLLVSAGILWLVRDPGPILRRSEDRGSLAEVVAIRALWPVLALMLVAYAPTAVIRGLWAGPYLSGVYGANVDAIGQATLVMGLAMVAGNFLLGPIDRITGSRKWGVAASVGLSAASLAVLVAVPSIGFWPSAFLLAGHGFFGATYPAIMAHGRSFLPHHLVGRGVSFINMFSIGGAGLMQFASRPTYLALSGDHPPEATFRWLFAFFLAPLVAGLILYLFSRDNRV